MASIIEQIEAAARPVLAGIKPQVVITAPNGQRLFIDVSPSVNPDQPDNSASLWPNGFNVSLATGTPPTAPDVTTDPQAFFVQQSPTLLAAPGPVGIPWGVWLAFFIFLAAAPFLFAYLRRK